MDEFIDDHISSDQVKSGTPKHFMIHKLMDKNNIKISKNVIIWRYSK
jgi:hypothetical protein